MVTLDEATSRALAGDARDLYALLARASGLPGERANLPLARTFAQACAADARGAALAEQLARISADEAPGGTSLEFLPVCGVLAAGAVAAREKTPRLARIALLRVIHDASDDLRFRVREAAPEALAHVGARAGEALLDDVDDFLDGYFHAAALLDALTEQAWLARVEDGARVASIVTRAFALLDASPRAAARYPGYKALVESLERSIAPLALKFGEPVIEAAAAFAKSADPHFRELAERALANKKLRARFPDEIRRASGEVASAKKPPRDPRSLPRPTRRRGAKRAPR